MSAFFQDLLRALLILVIGGFYIAALWKFVDWRTKFNDWQELFHKGNVALLCQRLGLLVAQPIAMSAVVSDFDVADPWGSSVTLAIQGAWIFVALVGAYYFVDWVVFPKIKNTEMLLERNVAIGVVEGAFFIAIGFLLSGSLIGEGGSVTETVISTGVFYVLGLAAVMGMYWLHIAVTSRAYCLRTKLAESNLPAAIELAGLLVGLGVVARVGVAGDMDGWLSAFAWFAVTVATGVVLLYMVRWVFNRLLFRENTVHAALEMNSVTAATFQAVIMVLSAFAVAALMSVV